MQAVCVHIARFILAHWKEIDGGVAHGLFRHRCGAPVEADDAPSLHCAADIGIVLLVVVLAWATTLPDMKRRLGGVSTRPPSRHTQPAKG